MHSNDLADLSIELGQYVHAHPADVTRPWKGRQGANVVQEGFKVFCVLGVQVAEERIDGRGIGRINVRPDLLRQLLEAEFVKVVGTSGS